MESPCERRGGDGASKVCFQRRQQLVTQVENVEIESSETIAEEPNLLEAPTATTGVLTEADAIESKPDAETFENPEGVAKVDAVTPVNDQTPDVAMAIEETDPSASLVDGGEGQNAEAAPDSVSSAPDATEVSESRDRVDGAESVDKEVRSASDDASTGDSPPFVSPEDRVSALEAEVDAAPHKVYSLGKVRRVLTEFKDPDGDEAHRTRIEAVESNILAQIAERKGAKEGICERAEALQESTEWRATGDKMRALFEEWKLIGGAGKKLDDELWQRFIAARERFSTRRTEHFAERQQVWAVAKEKKEALIAQAEALGFSTEWRSTADKIRNLQDQWKAAGSAGREADDKLWSRFNTAKQAFFDNRTAVWDANKSQKEALCLEAEALKESSDWRLTGDAMKAMQARWKEIGSAGKAAEDRLWERFRAATNAFFERREAAFAGKRQDERENLAKKQALVSQVETLVYTSNGLDAAREAKELQAQWKAVGHANREQGDALWARFRTACDRIFEAASSERDRQQSEWQGRMKDAMTRKREQLVSTRESIEHDEANLERWRATLSELRPGGRTSEIEASLDSKILDVINRIRAKNERVEELRATIADMEAKLCD